MKRMAMVLMFVAQFLCPRTTMSSLAVRVAAAVEAEAEHVAVGAEDLVAEAEHVAVAAEDLVAEAVCRDRLPPRAARPP